MSNIPFVTAFPHNHSQQQQTQTHQVPQTAHGYGHGHGLGLGLGLGLGHDHQQDNQHYQDLHPNESRSQTSLDYEKRSKAESEKKLSVVLGVVEGVLGDYRAIPDPVLRHSLFLDKFAIILRIGIEAMRSEYVNTLSTPDLSLRCDRVSADLLKSLSEMGEWIRNPMYSPDHPFGNHSMRQAEKRTDHTASVLVDRNAQPTATATATAIATATATATATESTSHLGQSQSSSSTTMSPSLRSFSKLSMDLVGLDEEM